MDFVGRYNDALNQIPPPGCGYCHVSLLRPANYGVMAGLDGDQIFVDIRQAVPPGNRHVSDREIWDAIEKAVNDRGKFTPTPKPKPIVRDFNTTFKKICEQGRFNDEADLWEDSPIRLTNNPATDTALFLKSMFEPERLIFNGENEIKGIPGVNIRTCADWLDYFANGGTPAPFLICNPLSGEPAPTKSDPNKMTFRGDHNIAQYRYCIAEFDTKTLEDQIRFWTAAKLPVVALVFTGGKSIHAWLDVQKLAKVETAEDWQSQIKGRLYDQLLTPLGVDSACSNPARLTRLPGHYRTEKRQYQRLLWLKGAMNG